MWKGVTEFLEKVDNTAAVNLSGVSEDGTSRAVGVDGLGDGGDGGIDDDAQYDGRQSYHGSSEAGRSGDNNGPDPTGYGDDDEDEYMDRAATVVPGRPASGASTPAVVHTPRQVAPTPPPPAVPVVTPKPRSVVVPSAPQMPLPPPSKSTTSVSIEEVQGQVRRLQIEMEQREAAFEAATRDRDKRYLALEGDYDAVTARSRGLDVELHHRADTIAELEAEVRKLAGEKVAAASLGETSSQDQARLHEDLRRSEATQAELMEQLDEATSKVTGLERAKGRAEESLMAANTALTQYKVQAKMLLDAKVKRVAELEGALAANSQSPDSGGTAEVVETTAEAVLERADVASLVASMVDTKVQAGQEEANRRLQQCQSELKAVQASMSEMTDNVKSLQLHNGQLQEMYEEEKRAAETASQRLQAAVTKHEQEVFELRKASHVGVGGKASDADSGLEAKVQEMAGLIMQKQQALEGKRAEADQWRTRFEVSSQRLREAEMVSNAVKLGRNAEEPRRYATDYGHAEEGRTSNAFRETALFNTIASKGRWGKKVAGAAEQMDTFSLSTGSYLRRNSTLRLALLAYVIILQLYVFVVVSINSVVQTGSVHEVNNNLLPNGQPVA